MGLVKLKLLNVTLTEVLLAWKCKYHVFSLMKGSSPLIVIYVYSCKSECV